MSEGEEEIRQNEELVAADRKSDSENVDQGKNNESNDSTKGANIVDDDDAAAQGGDINDEQQVKTIQELMMSSVTNSCATDNGDADHVNASNAVTSLDNNEHNSTCFNQITYLGSSRIETPCSESEMTKIMAVLNGEQSNSCIEVVITVPSDTDGQVNLSEVNGSEIANFSVHRIRFCARGQTDSTEKDCFAFSYTQQNSTATEPAVHQCHVFKCIVSEAAGRMLCSFAAVFQKGRTSVQIESTDIHSGMSNGESEGIEEDYQFEAFLEMKEEDAKKGYTLCPQEKNCFKLRRGREKRVVVVLQQFAGPKVLAIQKCFGLLLAAGRNVRHADMHLLDMQSMGRGGDNRVYVIEALWDPNGPHFEVLNTETPRETRVFMTIAADVILTGIHEPVRFTIECKARIFHQHERFWYVTRKPIVERYFLAVRKLQPNDVEQGEYQVVQFESATERERKMSRMSLGRSPAKMASQLVRPTNDDESDSDEPLLSGSGAVTQEFSDESALEWTECLKKWKEGDLNSRPKELNTLIRNGIPDLLRGEVWQLLCGCPKDLDMMDTYRLLIGKECPSDQVISRDIHRTFPAHDYFKESGGIGQEGLYRISKAYSLYDEEVGYCQGLSFLAASLLLHMPEEQAFCVLVKGMFDYGLRDLFKQGFDVLHLRFYQLERLIEDYVPDLYSHFYELHIESHMYASQWFLTLFTAKFPLMMVFKIIDLFLSEGMNTIFHISLALLRASKKELLQLDFEGALKYFRVSLPRKYRTDANANELIQQAVKLRISHKRLSKYEKEYMALKLQEAELQDPVDRLERENLRLKETTLRLERENDDLAHELVTSKIELRNSLDAAEDNVESLQNQLERVTRSNFDFEEENKHLHVEYDQVKDMCRREIERFEEEVKRNQSIIANYKQICSDLSHRLEKQQNAYREDKKAIMRRIKSCDKCVSILSEDGTVLPITSSNSPRDETPPTEAHIRLEEQEEHIRQLELELAQTKLALVEAQCHNQDLLHQLNSAQNEIDDSKNTWLKKTFISIKDTASSLKNQGGTTTANPVSHSRSNSSGKVALT